MREAGMNNREQRDRQFALLTRKILEVVAVDLVDPEMEVHVNAGLDIIAIRPEDGTEARSREPFMQRLEDSFAKAT